MKQGVKTDVGSFDLMFKKRHHILAEFDAFEELGLLELEYADSKKRSLTECLKDGYHLKMISDIKEMTK